MKDLSKGDSSSDNKKILGSGLHTRSKQKLGSFVSVIEKHELVTDTDSNKIANGALQNNATGDNNATVDNNATEDETNTSLTTVTEAIFFAAASFILFIYFSGLYVRAGRQLLHNEKLLHNERKHEAKDATHVETSLLLSKQEKIFF